MTPTGPTLLPFITQPKYNDAIKIIFKEAGITRNVTYLNPLTEKEEKVPINTIASSRYREIDKDIKTNAVNLLDE